ncbi:TIGR02450 family Trp-rich protein [Massilia sp. DJPM01]|uniref:TIGR02450 family Trp-rich protein n=1 Tax=Massilia sp. DJPM01 TaxID=3024404 RepID=UPI00259E20CF|nr:TIGR02450 family Trp-rich protein [Massilia sp. DJPM01]MDM5178355.1 TIGR02450 family Trp-rich protein [Massilia sp. DJPM01]
MDRQLSSTVPRAARRRAMRYAPGMNPLHPKKLLLSKWTALAPVNQEKHFIVIKVIESEPPGEAVEWVDLDAVHSRQTRRIACKTLRDETQWRQGWL